jgi:hypothetical protein
VDELPREYAELLNALLDGEATPDQRRRAEELERSDPVFAQQLVSLRLAESRIARLYSPAAIVPAPPRRTNAPRLHRPLLASAALLAIASIVGLLVIRADRSTRLDADALHAAFVLDPEPTTVCDTPDKFMAYTAEHLGEPIAARFDAGVTLVGWRSAGRRYDRSVRERLLLAYGANQEPIVVLFQPASGKPPRAANDTLHLYHARFAGVDAWEISPAGAPQILPVLALSK